MTKLQNSERKKMGENGKYVREKRSNEIIEQRDKKEDSRAAERP